MIVYKHYSQEQLNEQYNTRLQVPGYSDYFERWEGLSRQAEKEHTNSKDIFYGTQHQECVDIFPAEKKLAKTMVFIHGGYWHLLDKSLFHFLAPTFLKNNITTVFINYPLIPSASMDMIVSSCRKAMRWIDDNIMRFNGDPSQLYIVGHSAGGHLASMLLTDDLIFIKGVISLSGLFRLEPIALSYLNDVLRMDMDTAERNSPVFLKPTNSCPLLLVTGTDESDEFKDQTMEMYNSWKSELNCIKVLNIAGKNHYSIVDAVVETGSPLQSAIFHLMNVEERQIDLPQ